jgi:hypothetical protein
VGRTFCIAQSGGNLVISVVGAANVGDFELSLVPNIKPGMVVNPSGFDNYLKVFSSTNLLVMARSLFLRLVAHSFV